VSEGGDVVARIRGKEGKRLPRGERGVFASSRKKRVPEGRAFLGRRGRRGKRDRREKRGRGPERPLSRDVLSRVEGGKKEKGEKGI